MSLGVQPAFCTSGYTIEAPWTPKSLFTRLKNEQPGITWLTAMHGIFASPNNLPTAGPAPSHPIQSMATSGFSWTMTFALLSTVAQSELLSDRLTVMPTCVPWLTRLSPTDLNVGDLSKTFA